MTSESSEMLIKLDGLPGADDEEMTRLVGSLRTELRALDIRSVRQPVAAAPDKSKSGGVPSPDQLVVGLATSPDVLASVIGWIGAWLGRNRARSAKLSIGGDTLEVTGLSTAEQQRLIDLWVSRHGTGG
jgi:hypothetical protein